MASATAPSAIPPATTSASTSPAADPRRGRPSGPAARCQLIAPGSLLGQFPVLLVQRERALDDQAAQRVRPRRASCTWNSQPCLLPARRPLVAFQTIEMAIFAALASLCIGLTVYRVSRRLT